MSDRLQHGKHDHQGPFAVVRWRPGDRVWGWVVYGPAIAGIGRVPWWICDAGEDVTWPLALDSAVLAVEARRAETVRAMTELNTHGPRWWLGRRRRP